MSSNTDSSESESSSINYQRQPSRYVLAEELSMVSDTHQGDGDNDPVHVLLPSFAGVNRVFFIGTLTATADVSDANSDPYMKAEIVGPTGTFYVYAGQYQPEAKAFIQQTDSPAYVAVTGKPKTFENDDGDMLLRIAPEQMSTVSSEDRNRWVVDAARHTHRRLAFAQDGEVDPESADAITPDLFDPSGDDLERVRQAVITALEDVTELVGESEAATDDEMVANGESSSADADA